MSAPTVAELRCCISRILLTRPGSAQRAVLLATIEAHLARLATIERSYAAILADAAEELLLTEPVAGCA